MQINVNVYSDMGEFGMTAEEAATKVLVALDGDPEKDTCSVTLSWTPVTGYAGVGPTTPGMPMGMPIVTGSPPVATTAQATKATAATDEK